MACTIDVLIYTSVVVKMANGQAGAFLQLGRINGHSLRPRPVLLNDSLVCQFFLKFSLHSNELLADFVRESQ